MLTAGMDEIQVSSIGTEWILRIRCKIEVRLLICKRGQGTRTALFSDGVGPRADARGPEESLLDRPFDFAPFDELRA